MFLFRCLLNLLTRNPSYIPIVDRGNHSLREGEYYSGLPLDPEHDPWRK